MTQTYNAMPSFRKRESAARTARKTAALLASSLLLLLDATRSGVPDESLAGRLEEVRFMIGLARDAVTLSLGFPGLQQSGNAANLCYAMLVRLEGLAVEAREQVRVEIRRASGKKGGGNV
jgi:hypothetical protein